MVVSSFVGFIGFLVFGSIILDFLRFCKKSGLLQNRSPHGLGDVPQNPAADHADHIAQHVDALRRVDQAEHIEIIGGEHVIIVHVHAVHEHVRETVTGQGAQILHGDRQIRCLDHLLIPVGHDLSCPIC